MEELTDIRTSALSLETLLSVVALRSKASDHAYGSVFDIRLPDLLDQLPSLFFSKISEEVLVDIFSRLEDDPRNLARLACVCVRFARVIRRTVWRRQCLRVVPSVVSDLLPRGSCLSGYNASEPLGGWGGLQKLLVCCPGLKLAGATLEWWDFGLDRQVGSSEDYQTGKRKTCTLDEEAAQVKSQRGTSWVPSRSDHEGTASGKSRMAAIARPRRCAASASFTFVQDQVPCMRLGKVRQTNKLAADGEDRPHANCEPDDDEVSPRDPVQENLVPVHNEQKHQTSGASAAAGEVGGHGPLHVSSHEMKADLGPACETYSATVEDSRVKKVKRKKTIRNPGSERMPSGACSSQEDPHLACGSWSLTREEGKKLLARRFRADILYVCDWPGCIHPGKRRKYKLFRGLFKNFKSSLIWRNIGDLKSRKTALSCAFCSSSGTWDMGSTFCLRRWNEFHEDGEPVVRAYVCENGHVAGAWTDRPDL